MKIPHNNYTATKYAHINQVAQMASTSQGPLNIQPSSRHNKRKIKWKVQHIRLNFKKIVFINYLQRYIGKMHIIYINKISVVHKTNNAQKASKNNNHCYYCKLSLVITYTTNHWKSNTM